jgi:predicted RNA binding protein YcfA (HicA-like mRNA interferase family)
MTSSDQLAEQNVRLYQARLAHLDELLERARQGLENHPQREQHQKTLDEILKRRDELQVQLDEFKMRNPADMEEAVEKAGLMATWEVLAQDLEKLLEKLGV